MDAVGFSPHMSMFGEVAIKPRFCATGCVKCAPVSLAMRSKLGSSSSSVRSECSSSPRSSTCGNSKLFFSSSGNLVGTKRARKGGLSSGRVAVVKSLLIEERGASKERFADTSSMLENLKDGASKERFADTSLLENHLKDGASKERFVDSSVLENFKDGASKESFADTSVLENHLKDGESKERFVDTSLLENLKDGASEERFVDTSLLESLKDGASEERFVDTSFLENLKDGASKERFGDTSVLENLKLDGASKERFVDTSLLETLKDGASKERFVDTRLLANLKDGASKERFADTSLLENLKDFAPSLLESNRGTQSELRAAPDFTVVDDIDMNFQAGILALEEDKLWQRMREEARWDAIKEPLLASYLYSTILSHRSLEKALAFHLGNKLANNTLLSTQLCNLINDTFMDDVGIRRAIRHDIRAAKQRDPALVSYSHCLLNFKGYLACQAYRVAHRLWNQGRSSLALAIQSRISEVFHVDIHPAAQIGLGILIDHATGLVVGETARIGNNVSILHQVTVGGTGAADGDRHPKIGDGVLIGAGAIILGNVNIGDGAKIGAGSVVLIDVPPRTTAVGNPARLLGGKQAPIQLKEIPSETMDHTSFIKGWSDYII